MYFLHSVCTVLPFSAPGTEHLSNSNIISSSPDKEKLALFHPNGFGKYNSPNLSLSSTLSQNAFLHQIYVWFQTFPSLTLILSFIPTAEPLIPAFDHSLKASAITQISGISTNLFMLSFILPFPLLLLLSCILFSVLTFLCQN